MLEKKERAKQRQRDLTNKRKLKAIERKGKPSKASNQFKEMLKKKFNAMTRTGNNV